MIFTMSIGVEAKESFGDGEGHIPEAVEIGSALFDKLADWTKHAPELPFRVTSLAISQDGTET